MEQTNHTMPKLKFLSFLLFTTLVAPVHGVEVITPAQAAEGWIALFDGETLFGWKPTSDANWRVEDGEIRVDAGKQGWLMTSSRFSDFVIDLEFRCDSKTNSGVFFRSALNPTDPTKDCWELNIAPQDNPFPTGTVVGRRQEKHSVPYKAADFTVDPWDGKWHRLTLQASSDGRWTKETGYVPTQYNSVVTIDDLQTSACIGEGPAAGHIGLQFREGPIAFRNIRLKPRNLKPIFNGTDLSEWKPELAGTSEFKVTPQREIAVKNGPGQLETRESYGDFIMQLDCKVNGDGLNSGIFFRCIPDDKLMGYESQIHNGMKDGDPTQPADAGTGAIYRRTVARKIVAKDHEWITKTIIADGPHMAVWVNGIQVTDWTDERPIDENPRKGLRTKPGTIAIQGHDPTTDLLFKNLSVSELPQKE